MIPPGETIGILGGGQLGRMLAMAAAQLGYRAHVYAPEADSIAAEDADGFAGGDHLRDHMLCVAFDRLRLSGLFLEFSTKTRSC